MASANSLISISIGARNSATSIWPTVTGRRFVFLITLTSTSPYTDEGLDTHLGQRHFAGETPTDIVCLPARNAIRSEEHTSELQSLMRISYAVFCLKKKKQHQPTPSFYYP